MTNLEEIIQALESIDARVEEGDSTTASIELRSLITGLLKQNEVVKELAPFPESIHSDLKQSYNITCYIINNIESRKSSRTEIYRDHNWIRLMQIKTSIEKVYNQIYSDIIKEDK